MKKLINPDEIYNKIYIIRNIKIMLDKDLAELYGVETKHLKRQVKRNIKRFPVDFMFELSKIEFDNWRSQFGTSNSEKMGLRYSPMAFTEYGVAMLSSILHSERAIDVNIQIMRAFTQFRKIISTQDELKKIKDKIDRMEMEYDSQFKVVFDAIKNMISFEKKGKDKIGFE